MTGLKASLCLAVTVTLSPSASARIMSYNVLEGGGPHTSPKMCATLLMAGTPFQIETICNEDPASSAARYYASLGVTPYVDPARPGDIRRPESTYKLNMITVKPGSFKMGSPRSELERDASEGPVHKVSINYYFEVGKYEVTFEQWDTCVAGGGCEGYEPKDAGWGRGDRPVINVSWNDTQSYIKWLNGVTGQRYRLLSEAEWEYVARAGQASPFYTGKSITTKQANFNGQYTYGGSPKGPYRRKTVAVGSFAPNALGLHDIHGNVWEWTADCWSPNHKGAPANGAARSDGDCSRRVMKGGSWVNLPYQIRSAKRFHYTPDYRYDDYGFRIARTLSK